MVQDYAGKKTTEAEKKRRVELESRVTALEMREKEFMGRLSVAKAWEAEKKELKMCGSGQEVEGVVGVEQGRVRNKSEDAGAGATNEKKAAFARSQVGCSPQEPETVESAKVKPGPPDEEPKNLLARLKKPNLGLSTTTPASRTKTPKSGALAVESTTEVEGLTPGMQALKSARPLELGEDVSYPKSIKLPNPEENRKPFAYDKDFLLQFQPVVKEKPTNDWEQKTERIYRCSKEYQALYGAERSARPGSKRNPRGTGPLPTLTLPPGTTLQERFMANHLGMPPRRPAGDPAAPRYMAAVEGFLASHTGQPSRHL